MRYRHDFLHLFPALLLFLPPSAGMAAPETGESLVAAALVAESPTVVAGRPFWVAVRLAPKDRWHTYWKNPGDSGLPTKLEWTLPPGFAAGEIQWPYPERYLAEPLVDYVYHGETYHLVEVTPPATLAAGAKVPLKVTAKWLVCRELCLPGKKELTLTLVAGDTATPGPDAAAFAAARAKLPRRYDDWRATVERAGEDILLSVDGPTPPRGTLAFFPWNKGELSNGAPQPVEAVGNARKIRLKADTIRNQPFTRLQGVLLASEGWKATAAEALWIDEPITTVASLAAAPAADGAMLWQMLLFAFLGGMILNLMPCVFPVLSIKILSFVGQGGQSAGHSRRHGAVFAGGVLVSFWALAALLLVLRAAGRQLGWGFQLQSPPFVVALAVLFFLMGLQLLGFFEVGGRLTGVGGSLASKEGYAGSFFSGVLATIVATPCTAPFMGSALGFALSQPWYSAVLVFTALGLGMALPYFALSSSPQLLRRLPRPGRWMESLKEALAFPLFATVLWLLWVLGKQLGVDAVTWALGSLLLFGLGAWARHRWSGTGGGVKTVARVATTLSFFLALYVAYRAAHVPPALATAAAGDIAWIPYDRATIEELQKQGRPVFVDFTAAWCVTCQVNEQVVFASGEVRDRFRERNVATMKADWTNGDETITKALAEYGRSGVPFYLLYPKGGGKGIPLPEIITPGIVLDELKKLE